MLIQLLFDNPVTYTSIVVIVIASVVLHELAHGFAAIQQGDRTPVTSGHMTLDPVVHMGQASLIMLCVVGLAWGQMPVRPAHFRNRKWGEAIVSGAGPATNLALALLAIGMFRVSI